MQKNIYGLVGYPLSHSFSKGYFSEKFNQLNLTNCEYRNFELPNLNQLNTVLSIENLKGFNVTIPYKTAIITHLNDINEDAKIVGAINTVKIVSINNKQQLIGFNTDVYGFAQSIKPFLAYNHHKALILGNGGASKAVAYTLQKLGIEFLIVTRNPQAKNNISYQQLNDYAISLFPLIINTTPLGMYPSIDNCPAIPYGGITENHLCIDLIYNPTQTLFLKKAAEQGSKILNGLSMLQLQADKAWEIWCS